MMSEGDRCARIRSALCGMPASISPVRMSGASLAPERFGVSMGDSRTASEGSARGEEWQIRTVDFFTESGVRKTEEREYFMGVYAMIS